MRTDRFNSPLQADFDKYYKDNLRMYVNELAFCIGYCKAKGDLEMEMMLQEVYEKKSTQLNMLEDINKQLDSDKFSYEIHDDYITLIHGDLKLNVHKQTFSDLFIFLMKTNLSIQDMEEVWLSYNKYNY